MICVPGLMLALLTRAKEKENINDFSHMHKVYMSGLFILCFPMSIWGLFKAAAQCSVSVACWWSNFRKGKQGREKPLRFALPSVRLAKVLGALLHARVQ